MRNTLKFLLTLAAALLGTLAFKSLVVTICTIDGNGLEPVFLQGDRVVVNRWSYGLRTGQKNGLFGYGRICRREISKGDLLVFEDASGRTMICRCAGVPGDTVLITVKMGDGRKRLQSIHVPGLDTCDDRNYYWVKPIGKNNPLGSEQLGFIAEEDIIGRACLVLYSFDPKEPSLSGFRTERFLLPP